jgi:hypothetical protein
MRAGVVDTIDGIIDRQATFDREPNWRGGLLGGDVDGKHGDGIAQRRPRPNSSGDVVAPGGDGSGSRQAPSFTSQRPGSGAIGHPPRCAIDVSDHPLPPRS